MTTLQLAIVGYFSNNKLLAFGNWLLATQMHQHLVILLANGLLCVPSYLDFCHMCPTLPHALNAEAKQQPGADDKEAKQ